MSKYYAGIGSRETPKDICDLMTKLATKLANTGWILRSGGAKGADQAFERGVSSRFEKEIFYANDATPEALELAEKYHPKWAACSDYTRRLHARNGLILLGRDLDFPVSFICCWTPDGKVTGGTGQSLRIAADPEYNIPVHNLAIPDHLERVKEFLK